VAKILLTLNCHIENSEEEAAMTLLDLSSEPVASSGEPDDKNMQEFEQGKRNSFPEPIESQINTKADEKELKDCSTQVSETSIKTEWTG